jgi:hypothetical protein
MTDLHYIALLHYDEILMDPAGTLKAALSRDARLKMRCI